MSWPLVLAASTKLSDVIAFANGFVSSNDGDLRMVMGVTTPPVKSGPAIVTTLFHRDGSYHGWRWSSRDP